MNTNVRNLFFGGVIVLIIAGILIYPWPHQPIKISQSANIAAAAPKALPMKPGVKVTFVTREHNMEISWSKCSPSTNKSKFYLVRSNNILESGNYPCNSLGLEDFAKKVKPLWDLGSELDEAITSFIAGLP
jgi:hypothetical protein